MQITALHTWEKPNKLEVNDLKTVICLKKKIPVCSDIEKNE